MTRGLYCMEPKPCQDEGMAGNMNRPQNVFLQKAPFCRERTDEPSVAIPIHTKCMARFLDGVIQNCCGAAVKWMRERVPRINPLETMLV